MMLAARQCSRTSALKKGLRQVVVKPSSSATIAPATACRFLSSDGTNSNNTNLIINAVGHDRLGIVSDISGMVIRNGGNVGASQAARLGSHFSLMMSVDVPTGQLAALKVLLSDMPDMNVSVFETEEKESPATPQIAYSGIFTLKGADNPGIAHKLTSALASHGLSIQKLETDQEIAPYGGSVLFCMRGVAQAAAPLAQSFNEEQIRKELQELGDDLNCEVELEAASEEAYEAKFYSG